MRSHPGIFEPPRRATTQTALPGAGVVRSVRFHTAEVTSSKPVAPTAYRQVVALAAKEAWPDLTTHRAAIARESWEEQFRAYRPHLRPSRDDTRSGRPAGSR